MRSPRRCAPTTPGSTSCAAASSIDPSTRCWRASGASATRINIDEINHGQVQERHGSSAADLIAEIKAGHASAIHDLERIEDDTLAREIPLGFRPGTTTVGEMLRMAGAGHEGSHLDAIDAALGGPAAAS